MQPDPIGLCLLLSLAVGGMGWFADYPQLRPGALPDIPDETGFVANWGRVNFYRAHLQAALDAIDAGANLQGYFAWSLLDNFEWATVPAWAWCA